MSGGPGVSGPVRVGVIGDTHGTLQGSALDALAGVDAILHTGDLGAGTVLDELEAVAPVTLVRGNMDASGPGARAPLAANVAFGGVRFLVAHRERDLGGSLDPVRAGARVAVSGHTHVASVGERNGVLWVNPGSPSGPRQGSPATVAIVTVAADGSVSAEIVPLP